MTKALICMSPTKSCIDFLQCTIRHHLLQNFACKFQLLIVSNQLSHVIIGLKHDVPCIVRSVALRGHSDMSDHKARSLMALLCLRSHKASSIMLKSLNNKANLRDLIAATDLVIFHKLDSNHRFFGIYDLEILWVTSKNNRAPLQCYFKLCAWFHSHWSIQTGVTVRKRPIQVKIGNFLSRVTLKLEITNELREPWGGDVLGTVRAHGYSKLWQMSFSMNKPTTWCKSGWVSLMSSSCLYKTQLERALAQMDRWTDGGTETFIQLLGCS